MHSQDERVHVDKADDASETVYTSVSEMSGHQPRDNQDCGKQRGEYKGGSQLQRISGLDLSVWLWCFSAEDVTRAMQ